MVIAEPPTVVIEPVVAPVKAPVLPVLQRILDDMHALDPTVFHGGNRCLTQQLAWKAAHLNDVRVSFAICPSRWTLDDSGDAEYCVDNMKRYAATDREGDAVCAFTMRLFWGSSRLPPGSDGHAKAIQMAERIAQEVSAEQ